MKGTDARAVLLRPFRADECRARRDERGEVVVYVDGHAVISRLIEAYGPGGLGLEGGEPRAVPGQAGRRPHALGRARLTVPCPDGGRTVLEGHGSAEVEAPDPGRPWKAALTDAIKVCCRLLGVGLHLYDRDDPVRLEVEALSSGRPGKAPASPPVPSMGPSGTRPAPRTSDASEGPRRASTPLRPGRAEDHPVQGLPGDGPLLPEGGDVAPF